MRRSRPSTSRVKWQYGGPEPHLTRSTKRSRLKLGVMRPPSATHIEIKHESLDLCIMAQQKQLGKRAVCSDKALRLLQLLARPMEANVVLIGTHLTRLKTTLNPSFFLTATYSGGVGGPGPRCLSLGVEDLAADGPMTESNSHTCGSGWWELPPAHHLMEARPPTPRSLFGP